eukprot:5523457-Prymnesium_polylepis.2
MSCVRFSHCIQHRHAIPLLRKCDEDGDGRVSLDEFRKGMDVLGIGTEVEADVVKVFELIDCNKTGLLYLKVRIWLSRTTKRLAALQ